MLGIVTKGYGRPDNKIALAIDWSKKVYTIPFSINVIANEFKQEVFNVRMYEHKEEINFDTRTIKSNFSIKTYRHKII